MRIAISALVIATSLALGGCAAAVVGAAAGGYYAGKDERPASVIAADAAITASVKTKLIADSEVKAFDINVDTYEGVVTLKGTVRRASQASAAVADARTIKGVKSVRNELKVD